MLTKFLFDVDAKGKNVLYGVIEDELDGSISIGEEIDYCFKSDYDEESISRNLGGQCFVVFDDNGINKYLDIDFYKNKAKIQLTEKVAYAIALPENIIDIILEYLDVTLKYEIIYGCYYEHPKKGTVDILERQFKGLFTDSYVQILKDNCSYFLAKNEKYFLTEDLTQAKKFHKSEIRKILIINKFVDRTTELKQLYFSPYQLLRGNDEFIMFHPIKLQISKRDDSFIINSLPIIENTHLLCKSEIINTKMKEISKLINNNDIEEGYVTCYSKYLQKNEIGFSLTSNPAQMSLVNKSDYNLFASIYSMFSESEVKFIQKQNLVYVYETMENNFKITNKNEKQFIDSNVIKENTYYDFLKYFVTNPRENEKGFILFNDDKYISINLKDSEFEIFLNDSSYEATIFNENQVKVLKNIFKFDFLKFEIKNILTDLKKYNISISNKQFDIIEEYTNIVNLIKNKNYKISLNNTTKFESEKSSLEYLRKHYFKSINDSEILFSNILEKNNISNVLLVDSMLNLDLIALNNVAIKLNKKINVSLLIKTKVGFYPKANLSNININNIYRLEFISLPNVILKQFDLILFGRYFPKQDKKFENILKSIIKSQDVVLANVKHCGFQKVDDSFSSIFSKIKRKHFIDYENSDEIISLSREIEDFANILYTSNVNSFEFLDPIVEKKFSYHSIVIVKNSKVYDFY